MSIILPNTSSHWLYNHIELEQYMMFANQPQKVLVVDDNKHNCELVRALLDDDGFEVATANDGASALEIFEVEQPALVLLDIMMPGMNGYEVCERIRRLPDGEDVGIVFLTALDDYGSYQRAVEAGANDFLTKPINGDELLMRTRSLLWVYQLRDEIEQGTYLLRQQRESMLSLQRTKDEMTGFLVHDIKNMLASLISNAQYLERQLDEHELLRDAASDIVEVGNTMKKLTHDVLELDRGEDGVLVVRRTPVDLGSVLEELCHNFKRNLQISDQDNPPRVTADILDELRCEVDEDLIVRMVENLLDNAAKYAPDGSAITVSARWDNEHVRIEVRDEGPGIAPDYRDQVFKKYFRIKDGRSGTGVGLAFCRIVALEHGGSIWIEENEPSGCVVCTQLRAQSGAVGHE